MLFIQFLTTYSYFDFFNIIDKIKIIGIPFIISTTTNFVYNFGAAPQEIINIILNLRKIKHLSII